MGQDCPRVNSYWESDGPWGSLYHSVQFFIYLKFKCLNRDLKGTFFKNPTQTPTETQQRADIREGRWMGLPYGVVLSVALRVAHVPRTPAATQIRQGVPQNAQPLVPDVLIPQERLEIGNLLENQWVSKSKLLYTQRNTYIGWNSCKAPILQPVYRQIIILIQLQNSYKLTVTV